ncbi:MAG: thermonuclease family protein [Proteobacteria bacterium]|nr:thermonuclease family protein [Pseudomonadota bacterium]
MLKFLTIILLLVVPSMASATCFDWPLRTPPVYDGDTLRITMPGLPPELSEMLVRVAGVDTPEIRGKCEVEKTLAIQARDFVVRSLKEARSVKFCNPVWGKYGKRVIAEVVLDGQSLAAILIERNLGRPYGGGRRKGWCQ